MKYLRIILIFLLLPSCIDDDSPFGEGVSFLKYYGDGNSNIGIKAISLGSEGYILGGYTVIQDSAITPNVIKVDLLGNKVWETTVSPDTNSHVLQDMIVNSEGDYILLSTVSRESEPANARQDIRMTKLNSIGEVEWFKDFGNDSIMSRNDGASAIIQTADGGYAFIGTTQTSTDNTDLFVVRTNSAGDKIWDRVYGSSGDLNDEGIDILEFANGNLAWFGTRQISSNRERIRLVIANPIGNLIDDISYQPEDEGNIIVSNSVSAGEIAINNNQLFMTGSVEGYFVAFSTDLSGELDWEIVLDNNPNANELGTSLAITDLGDVVVVGRSNVSSLQGDIYMLSLSSTGNVNWEQTYGTAGREFAQSVSQTPDGGYAIFGTVDLDNSNLMMSLIKTDSEGNISE